MIISTQRVWRSPQVTEQQDWDDNVQPLLTSNNVAVDIRDDNTDELKGWRIQKRYE